MDEDEASHDCLMKTNFVLFCLPKEGASEYIFEYQHILQAFKELGESNQPYVKPEFSHVWVTDV